jgi:hypothetical protein
MRQGQVWQTVESPGSRVYGGNFFGIQFSVYRSNPKAGDKNLRLGVLVWTGTGLEPFKGSHFWFPLYVSLWWWWGLTGSTSTAACQGSSLGPRAHPGSQQTQAEVTVKTSHAFLQEQTEPLTKVFTDLKELQLLMTGASVRRQRLVNTSQAGEASEAICPPPVSRCSRGFGSFLEKDLANSEAGRNLKEAEHS